MGAVLGCAGLSWVWLGWVGLGWAKLAFCLAGRPNCLWLASEISASAEYNVLSDNIPKYTHGADAVMPVLSLLYALGPFVNSKILY